jgi:hypothetical protein
MCKALDLNPSTVLKEKRRGTSEMYKCVIPGVSE